MKKIVTWLLATVGGVVLLFSYKTSTQSVAPGLPSANGSTATSAPTQPQAGTTPQGSAGSASSGLQDGTYTGASADTPYGPVQVRITVQGGQITAANAVTYPTESRRDEMINAYAIPVLQQESVGATSAQLDFVSGATFTSNGYLGSLQDAIDQAAGR
ncbi:FMN-binding protein [Xylanimonas sp. McL0601]|uniref:FMN-binding protein n=1 Tax=Xylanimonas sp. McL0601 TaxID=3414739 RepID=UPI003CF5CDE1